MLICCDVTCPIKASILINGSLTAHSLPQLGKNYVAVGIVLLLIISRLPCLLFRSSNVRWCSPNPPQSLQIGIPCASEGSRRNVQYPPAKIRTGGGRASLRKRRISFAKKVSRFFHKLDRVAWGRCILRSAEGGTRGVWELEVKSKKLLTIVLLPRREEHLLGDGKFLC